METKKIGDAIEAYGIPMAMHFAGSPVSCMANVRCASRNTIRDKSTRNGRLP